MIISKLDIIGFRSMINRTTLNLNSPGVNIITGNNGVGKSQIWNALSWCWFGKTLNEATDIETYKELRKDKYVGIRVASTIKKDGKKYQIIKTKNFKGFDGKDKRHTGVNILIDGKPMEGLRDANDYRKEILNLLGISFRVFRNSIMFGQKLKRIIEESGGEQKDLFTEAFEVDYIKEAKKKAEDRFKWINSDLEPLLKKLDYAKIKYDSYKRELVSEKQAERNFQNSKDERLTIVNLNKEKVQNELDNLMKEPLYKFNIKTKKRELDRLKEENQTDPTKRLIDLNEKLSINRNRLANEKEEIKRLKKQKEKEQGQFSSVCFNCGQPLNTGKVTELRLELNNRIRSIDKAMGLLNVNIETRAKVIEMLEGKVSSINKEIELNNSRKDKIELLQGKIYKAQIIHNSIVDKEDNLRNIEEQIDGIKNLTFPHERKRELKKKIRKYSLRQTIYESKIEPLKKELELVSWVIKDPLSNKGLSSYIFNSMLTNLNKKLKFYSSLVGFDISFKIRIESARKDFFVQVYHRGVLKDYKSLSGGEAQLTNLAIAFAIHDIIDESKELNLLVLDEAFESLDDENKEVVAGLIEAKAKNKCVWFITHLKNLDITNAKKYRIHFSKETGTTIEYC